MVLNDDESVRIAVHALGDMRNSAFQPTPALSATSGTSSPSLPSPLSQPQPQPNDFGHVVRFDGRLQRHQGEDPDFVSRMSSLPIVNSALRVYEQGKASSRVVKYGAEMMESSVKTISRPVIERLPVGQLDEFACRQLDKLEHYTRRNSSGDRDQDGRRGRTESMDYDHSLRHDAVGAWETRDVSMTRDASRSRPGEYERREEGDTAYSSMQVPDRTHTPRSQYFPHDRPPPSLQLPPIQRHQSRTPPSSATIQSDNSQVAHRSRWQAMLFEAGGLSAAVSEESMRRLRYCLQWLQYATAHIDAQILVLRNFITSLQPQLNSSTSLTQHTASVLVSQHHLRTLNAAKRDVVDTLRQVVDVVSRYAGGALPEPARTRVRTFILRLPKRFAEAAGVDSQTYAHPDGTGRSGGGADRVDMRRTNGNAVPYSYGPGEAGPSPRSRPPSRTTSPAHSRAHSRQATGASASAPTTVDSASQAAQRILTLATESLDMLRGVTTVVSESLDRADAWVERLRVVGLQRQQTGDLDTLGEPPSSDNVRMEDRSLPPLRSSSSLPSFYTPRQDYSHSQPHSPTSPLSPFSLSGSAANSGYNTPAYALSRNSSSSALSMGPPGSQSSYYSAGSLDAGGAAASLNALSLSSHSHSQSHSNAGSRFATPKNLVAGLPPEGDGGGGGTYLAGPASGAFAGSRGEKRSAEGDDATVVAATALAGLAGSAKRAKQDHGRDDRMELDA